MEFLLVVDVSEHLKCCQDNSKSSWIVIFFKAIRMYIVY